MYSLEEEVKKIKESVKNLNNLPLQKINVIFDSIKNVYNLQTFDFIYNKVKYMKLDKMNKKLKKELDDINLAKSMVSNYDDTAKKKMEMNFYEYNKIKKKLDSLKIMFLLVTILIIFPILVHMRILPKLPAVLGWGICIIMIIIIGVFLLFIRDKYKPQFCTKDEDGFEQCSDVNNDTRYYENLDLLEKKSSAYTLDDLSDMSNSEKKRCEKWEGVKDEFDFDHIKCPNFLKEDTPPYTGSCLPIDPAPTTVTTPAPTTVTTTPAPTTVTTTPAPTTVTTTPAPWYESLYFYNRKNECVDYLVKNIDEIYWKFNNSQNKNGFSEDIKHCKHFGTISNPPLKCKFSWDSQKGFMCDSTL